MSSLRNPIPKTVLVAALTLAACGSVWAQALETPSSAGPVAMLDTPIFRIPMMKKPPTIDGKMEPKEWEDASALSCFWYDRVAAHFYFLAPWQTQLETYAAFDKEYLYIAYSSPVYPESSWLKALGRYPDVVGHPQYGLQWDDHIELEIRPYHDVVKGFRMGLFKWYGNPIGTISDWHWAPDQAGTGKMWQSDCKAASHVTDTRWTIEYAIPLKSMVHGDYAGKEEDGTPIVQLPVPDGTAFRVWFTRAIGGNGAFFNAFDNHAWNTTKTKMILDSKAPSFQINDLGEIMNDTIDVDLTVKNHNDRSETLRIGFFVESAEGLIYSSYDDEELSGGLVELVPGEVRKLNLSKKFPGITKEGNTLWFDVRAAGTPAKPLFQTRLVDFHSMEGGEYRVGDETTFSFKWKRIDVIERMRPARKEFDWWYTYSHYKNRISAVVDKGIYGGSDEAKSAVEAKLTVMEDTEDAKVVAEETVPFVGEHASFLVQLPELRQGTYKALILLFDQNKRIVGEAEPAPFYRGEYEWVHNKVGKNDVVWEPFVAIKGDTQTLDTLKHRFTLSPSGLPAQIYIKPDVTEVPLEYRGDVTKTPEDVLVKIGRGPQLLKPMRLVAEVEGKTVEAEVVEPAKRVKKWKSEHTYESKVKVGPLDAKLTVRYDCDGSMWVDINWGPAGDAPVEVDSFQVVADFAGHFDLAVSAAHGGGMEGPDKKDCYLPQEPDANGLIWSSKEVPLPEMFYSRLIPWFLFGSGDRAFTFTCGSDEGLELDRETAMITLHRQKPGELTGRFSLVNHPAEIDGRHEMSFMWLTHPSKTKPDDYRRIGWFLKGGNWASLWGGLVGDDETLRAQRGGANPAFARQWRRKHTEEYLKKNPGASPKDATIPPLPEKLIKKDPPWDRWYQLRGTMPLVESTRKNALLGDLLGTSKELKTTKQVKLLQKDGTEEWATHGAGGIVAYFGEALEDFFAWHFGRQIRLARRHGFWWDETWPPKRSVGNLASGDAYLRDPEDILERELPWQDTFMTTNMRNLFKRLARVYAEEGMPQRQHMWANTEATTFEAYCYDTSLVEAAGSDHASFDLDVMVIFPLAQYRFNSQNHTGLLARVQPKNATQPGDDKRLTRSVLGRALAHDVCVQPQGPHGYLEQPEQVIRIILELKKFGFFSNDKMTEYLPYWRAREAIELGDGRNQVNNPKVYATVYRRPLTEDGKVVGTAAMIVICNETDDIVHVPVEVTDPARVFGGANTLTDAEVVAQTQAPEGASKSLTEALKAFQSGKVVLRDAEGHGYVAQTAKKGKAETYGPLQINPHNFRLLYGEFRKDK